MTGKETSYFFSFSQKVPPLKVFHTRYKCVLFFDFGLIGIQSISSIVLISLTAKLAITGDWGRPQQAGLQIRTEGRMLQMLHLYIQMPCLPVCYTWNKSVISEFALMNSEKSLVFIENSLKICYNPSCHAVAYTCEEIMRKKP